MHVRFGASGKRWAVHGNVSSAIVEAVGMFGYGFEKQFAHVLAVWICEGNVGGDAFPEKGMFMATAGEVDDLIWDDDITWVQVFTQRTDGGDGDDPTDIERTQRPDICAVIDFTGEQAVTATMTWEKKHAAPREFALDDFIGGWAERSLDGVCLDDFERIDFVEAGAADDGEGR